MLLSAALVSLALAVRAMPHGQFYLGAPSHYDNTYEQAIERIEELRYNMTHDWEGDPSVIVPRLPSSCPYVLAPINCAVPASVPPAVDARSLLPGNIDAVIGVGDSITAGFAIDSGKLPLGALTEYRGRSWGPGGEQGIDSIFNYLKVFNPSVAGGAEGTTPALSKGVALSAAVSAARVDDLLEQVLEIEARLNTPEYTVAREGWKVWTVLIGANDVCQACKAEEADLPERFERDLRDALTEIKTRIPKSFVNVVGLFNVSGVYLAAQKDIYCRLILPTLGFCPCSENANDRLKMDLVTVKINDAMRKVIAEFGTSDPNFHAVWQPALVDIDILDYGQNFLSNLDCFHPNRCAHAAFAVGVWNNMYEPEGSKGRVRDPKDLRISCPGPDVFLQ